MIVIFPYSRPVEAEGAGKMRLTPEEPRMTVSMDELLSLIPGKARQHM
jgi:hypothetical protein